MTHGHMHVYGEVYKRGGKSVSREGGQQKGKEGKKKRRIKREREENEREIGEKEIGVLTVETRHTKK